MAQKKGRNTSSANSFANGKQRQKGVRDVLSHPITGLLALLCLSLIVGLVVGHFMRKQADEVANYERRERILIETQDTPAMVFSLETDADAISAYYEEHIKDLPQELRANPNQAPEDALAAGSLLKADTSANLPSVQQTNSNQTNNSQLASLNINQEQLPRWLKHAVAYNYNGLQSNQNQNFAVPTKEAPMIAIILDDIGLDKPRSYQAIDLDGIITLAVLPYGDGLDPIIDAAREKGHELMLHLPMQPISEKADPGPNALLNDLNPDEIRERLNWNLNRINHYVGVNNHMGSAFTANPEMMQLVLNELDKRGLLFVDSVTSGQSQAYRIAQDMGMPHAVRDVFIDNERNQTAILNQLAIVEETARMKGYAVAIGHPHDATIAALKSWMPTLDEKNITLVPISAIVKRQQYVLQLAKADKSE